MVNHKNITHLDEYLILNHLLYEKLNRLSKLFNISIDSAFMRHNALYKYPLFIYLKRRQINEKNNRIDNIVLCDSDIYFDRLFPGCHYIVKRFCKTKTY